jgi:dUTP pyrophosphatase
MTELKIKKLDEYLPDISYATDGSSGFDLRSAENTIVPVGMIVLVKTGIEIEIPEGYEGQVRPRSGLALKNGITILNSPGTIDSDYRNEVGVILMNLGIQDFEIGFGDRIAQMVISKYEKCNLVLSDELSDPNTRKGGFGSTGV